MELAPCLNVGLRAYRLRGFLIEVLQRDVEEQRRQHGRQEQRYEVPAQSSELALNSAGALGAVLSTARARGLAVTKSALPAGHCRACASRVNKGGGYCKSTA